MLTGTELGKAIEAARLKKGVSKADMARHFDVKPPSISGWIATGRIDKKKLSELFEYFRGDVGPEHWGLGNQPSMIYGDHTEKESMSLGEPDVTAAYGNVFMKDLSEIVTPRSKSALDRIIRASAEGRLTEDDIDLLQRIAERFEGSKRPTAAAGGNHKRLRDKLTKNDSDATQ